MCGTWREYYLLSSTSLSSFFFLYTDLSRDGPCPEYAIPPSPVPSLDTVLRHNS